MKLRRISEVWSVGPRIDILKVDCEGGEYGIFRDLNEETGVRVVILNIIRCVNAGALRETLAHGFQFDWPGGNLNVVVAKKQVCA